MMKKHIYCLLLAIGMVGCADDSENLTPSGNDRNWLVVEAPADGNALDRLRYDIYSETDIPIFYNDTIGSMERTTNVGNPYTYYEKLQVFYRPGVTTPPSTQSYFVLPHDKSKVQPVVQFLYDEVIPQIPASVYIPSFLIVDKLVVNKKEESVYKGFNTYVCSHCADFDKIDRKKLKGKLLSATIASEIMQNKAEWLEENFYGLTYAVNPDNQSNLYSVKYAVYVYRGWMGIDLESLDMQTLCGLGFIGTYNEAYSGSQERLWQQPTKEQDLMQYCEAALVMSEREFLSTYVENPHGHSFMERCEVIEAKYYAIKGLLEEYGFTIE